VEGQGGRGSQSPSSIGVDRSKWSSIKGLTVDDGSVYLMPDNGPLLTNASPVLLAQITISNDTPLVASMSVQGRSAVRGLEWQAHLDFSLPAAGDGGAEGGDKIVNSHDATGGVKGDASTKPVAHPPCSTLQRTLVENHLKCAGPRQHAAWQADQDYSAGQGRPADVPVEGASANIRAQVAIIAGACKLTYGGKANVVNPVYSQLHASPGPLPDTGDIACAAPCSSFDPAMENANTCAKDMEPDPAKFTRDDIYGSVDCCRPVMGTGSTFVRESCKDIPCANENREQGGPSHTCDGSEESPCTIATCCGDPLWQPPPGSCATNFTGQCGDTWGPLLNSPERRLCQHADNWSCDKPDDSDDSLFCPEDSSVGFDGTNPTDCEQLGCTYTPAQCDSGYCCEHASCSSYPCGTQDGYQNIPHGTPDGTRPDCDGDSSACTDAVCCRRYGCVVDPDGDECRVCENTDGIYLDQLEKVCCSDAGNCKNGNITVCSEECAAMVVPFVKNCEGKGMFTGGEASEVWGEMGRASEKCLDAYPAADQLGLKTTYNCRQYDDNPSECSAVDKCIYNSENETCDVGPTPCAELNEEECTHRANDCIGMGRGTGIFRCGVSNPDDHADDSAFTPSPPVCGGGVSVNKEMQTSLARDWLGTNDRTELGLIDDATGGLDHTIDEFWKTVVVGGKCGGGAVLEGWEFAGNDNCDGGESDNYYDKDGKHLCCTNTSTLTECTLPLVAGPEHQCGLGQPKTANNEQFGRNRVLIPQGLKDGAPRGANAGCDSYECAADTAEDKYYYQFQGNNYCCDDDDKQWHVCLGGESSSQGNIACFKDQYRGDAADTTFERCCSTTASSEDRTACWGETFTYDMCCDDSLGGQYCPGGNMSAVQFDNFLTDAEAAGCTGPLNSCTPQCSALLDPFMDRCGGGAQLLSSEGGSAPQGVVDVGQWDGLLLKHRSCQSQPGGGH
jgi:hypothetical protein